MRRYRFAPLQTIFFFFCALTISIAGCGGSSGSSGSSTKSLTHCKSRSSAFADAETSSTAATAYTDFATCLTNSGGAGANVEVGGNQCPSPVLVQSNQTAGTITVDSGAKLDFADATYTLTTTGIIDNGKVEACNIGLDAPTNQVTINFAPPSPTASPTPGHSLGITVNSGGTLVLEGHKGTVPIGGTSWTNLSCPAGPLTFGPGNGAASPVLGASSTTCPGGPNTLQVAASVASDWQPGDWIVVGTTDFAPQDSEFVQIASMTTTSGVKGTTITLSPNTPLTQYHFGGAAPDSGAAAFSDDYTKNYGIDERAEVGLISRNIKLTSTVSPATSHWGGELDLEQGSNARLWGVEIEKFGKPQPGSYPANFIGSVTFVPSPDFKSSAAIMDSDSIHHSYNHGIVLSSPSSVNPGNGSGGASDLGFANNVVARAVSHLFLIADGNEVGNSFTNNLGLGAMSNSFAIPSGNDQLGPGYTAASAAAAFWWVGDYLTNNPSNQPCSMTKGASPCYNGYDGFNIANTDSVNKTAWASGFYISDVQNALSGNSIGGCQGEGRGFWYLPYSNGGACKAQTIAEANTPQLSAQPPASGQWTAQDAGYFADNRAHACYTGLDSASDVGTDGTSLLACSLAPVNAGADVYTQIEGMTATRNRNRGIWVRPNFYVVDGARLATNRDSLSVVSSGGTEGSPPGEWSVVSNSIFAGVSANNPGRFGPCPYQSQGAISGGGSTEGCLDEDQVTGPAGGNGYPTPRWNLEGEMLYDGPARLSGNQFVNFLTNPAAYLLGFDQSFLSFYASVNKIGTSNVPFVYEGDAAFGWFQSNVNSYPPTQYSEEAKFNNTDLRHQVYTADVNLSTFQDGDKDTVILDEDGQTLSGYEVVPAGCNAPCTAVANKSPISLNNLPFVSTPNAVDECLAEGPQDAAMENRPTALMSPQDYATLEFSMQTPSTNSNYLVFAKDQLDFGGLAGQQYDTPSGGSAVTCPSTHSCMALVGRNSQGVYEPKVINGLGYTVTAQQGMQQYVDVTFTDASVAGGISSSNPFQIRLSICYGSQANGGPASASAFTVSTGVKSLGALTVESPADLTSYWNLLTCNGLDNADPATYVANCFTVPPNQALTALDPTNVNPLATDLAALKPGQYYYNPTTGFLTLIMQQTAPNGAAVSGSIPLGGGPSPVGSCGTSSSDPCPDVQHGETFYSCPEGGCGLYTITVNKSGSYTPVAGQAACSTPYGGALDYTASWPANMNQLAYTNGTPITTTTVASNMVNGTNYPHITDNNPTDACPAPSSVASPTPPWIGAGNQEPTLPIDYTLAFPAGYCLSGSSPSVSTIPGTELLPLSAGSTYSLTFCEAANSQSCSAQVVIPGSATQANATFTSAGTCGLPTSGGGTIGPGALTFSGGACSCSS